VFTVSLDLCTDVQLVVLFTDSKSTMRESSVVAFLGAGLAMWAIFPRWRLVIEDIRAAYFGVAALADCLPFFSESRHYTCPPRYNLHNPSCPPVLSDTRYSSVHFLLRNRANPPQRLEVER
jgi:hypothetical protein